MFYHISTIIHAIIWSYKLRNIAVMTVTTKLWWWWCRTCFCFYDRAKSIVRIQLLNSTPLSSYTYLNFRLPPPFYSTKCEDQLFQLEIYRMLFRKYLLNIFFLYRLAWNTFLLPSSSGKASCSLPARNYLQFQYFCKIFPCFMVTYKGWS